MAFTIKTFGPIPIHQRNGEANISDFLARVNAQKRDLSEANGLYIFAQPNTSSGSIPWYVGKTTKSFERRFRSHFGPDRAIKTPNAKTRKVIKRIQEKTNRDVQLEVFLIAILSGRKGAAAKLTDSREKWIRFLETALIGACFAINPDLRNEQDTHLFRKVPVPGFLDQGLTRDEAASSLAAMLMPRRNN